MRWQDHGQYLVRPDRRFSKDAPAKRLIAMGDFNEIIGACQPRTPLGFDLGLQPVLPMLSMSLRYDRRLLSKDVQKHRGHIALSEDLAVESTQT